MATAEFSKFADILSAVLSGFEIAQLEFHDLHQIPYYYTVEVRNRFKGLYLMEVPDIVQETGIKTITKIKKFRRAKWLSEEALQIAMKRS